LSEKLLQYLLKQFEDSPETKFYESDLTRVSSAGFSALKKQKGLIFDQYDFESEHYFDKQGNERFVRKYNGKWRATPTEDSGISPLYLKEKDLNRYAFSVGPLLKDIKVKNGLTKNTSNISSRIWFIGECDSGNRQFGVFLGLFSESTQAEELLGIRSRVGQYEYILVLCPTFEISDQGLLNRLEGQKIYCRSFKQACKGGYKIDFGIVKDLEKPTAGFVIPELNATERRKYQKNYPRRDVIEFVERQNSGRKGILLINGQELELEYNLYGILLALAKALKSDTDTGWVQYDSIANEKLVRSRDHFHRSLSELSRLTKALVEKSNAAKLIENQKRKSKYRLSTMPSRIKTPHSRWLASRYKTIKDEIIKERTKRVGAANV
jgi:hypothetical protein